MRYTNDQIREMFREEEREAAALHLLQEKGWKVARTLGQLYWGESRPREDGPALDAPFELVDQEKAMEDWKKISDAIRLSL